MALTSVRALLNGTWYTLTLNSATGLYEATVTAPPAPGLQTITGQAINSSGYQATASTEINIRWEAIPPVAAITSPSEGGWYANARQPITFTLRDEAGGSGVDLSTLALVLDERTFGSTSPGMVCTAVTNGYDCTYTPPAALSEGNHTVFVSVRDLAENQSAAVSRSWKIDTEAPSLAITFPQEGAATNQPTMIVTGTAGDAGIGLASLIINGVKTPVEGGKFSGTVSLVNGTNTITVIAVDALGHISIVTRSVLVDIIPPAFRYVHIAPDLTASPLGQTFMVTVVMADTPRPNSKETVTGTVNGVPAAFTEGPELTWTAKVPRADSDIYDVALTAFDAAGNSAEYSTSFPCGMESKWTWEPIDFLNFWDLNRIERNTDYIHRWLEERGYIVAITTIKTTWDEPDIPTRSGIDRIRRNVDALQEAFLKIPDWRDILYDNGFDYNQVNALEWDLHLLDLWIDRAAKSQRIYSGQIYSGMWP